jgi:hypothetical protein
MRKGSPLRVMVMVMPCHTIPATAMSTVRGSIQARTCAAGEVPVAQAAIQSVPGRSPPGHTVVEGARIQPASMVAIALMPTWSWSLIPASRAAMLFCTRPLTASAAWSLMPCLIRSVHDSGFSGEHMAVYLCPSGV